jgi:hypothetical protein
MGESSVYFSEVQRTMPWWVYAAVAAVALVMWWASIQQVVLGRPFGSRPAPSWLVIVFTVVFGIGFPAFFALLRMDTAVTDADVRFRVFPLHIAYRSIRGEQIESYSHVEYRALVDYGGYGIRLGLNGWAYNIRGNEGVRFVLKNGRRILLGSSRAPELTNAVERMLQVQGIRLKPGSG